MSCKEIDPSTIEKMRIEAIETVCLIEENFPTSIMTIQIHALVYLVDEVALAGTVHTRWMFFLERFMKTLKGFVRQKAKPEGSMAEGWLIQESCVWISEYLGDVDSDLPLLWSTADDERIVGDVLQGQGTDFRMSTSLREKVMKFCICNAPEMEKWVSLYEETRRSDPSLPHSVTHDWIRAAVLEAQARGEKVTDVELDYAHGCLWQVQPKDTQPYLLWIHRSL